MWDGVKRRKTDMDNFQPKDAFEGYVYANIENIKEILDKLPLKCETETKRITNLENKISNIEGKTTIIGVIGGFLAGIVGKVFFWK